MRIEPASRLRVRHELTSVALVRNRLATDLRRRGLPEDTVADAALVMSELITNAVRHTPDNGALEVSWSVDTYTAPAEVEVGVSDASPRLPEKRPLQTEATGGRGIRIVEALAATWGVDEVNAGKRVWARLRLPISY